LAATAQSLGHDIDELNISRSIRRGRGIVCAAHYQNLKEQFQTSASLVVHWDGKLLPDITGKEMVDRLPVIVSGVGINQLLGVPKISAGTGEAQACAVMQLLVEWGLVDRVSGMCFDTTASNTGRTNGACVLLEQKLNRDMLHLACRHHVLELILGSVFKESLGLSSGPDVAIFKRFQQHWQFINQLQYETGEGLHAIANCKDFIIAFACSQLMNSHPRDDYRELLELAIVFLGGVPPRGVHFSAPGAMHHARWMAKALYTFKIWLFRGQFSLTMREELGLRDVCVFLVSVYIQAWFTAPNAAGAPRNDLDLIQRLVTYEHENSTLSKIAFKKFAGQLWYLSEELVGLSFFDNDIPIATKRDMVKSLVEHDGLEEPPKRIQLDIQQAARMTITNLVTKNTMNFFRCLRIESDFLDADPESWRERDDYRHGQEVVAALKVINDDAERGVALIEEYNALITKNEEQKQFLLQVVQDHRRRLQ